MDSQLAASAAVGNGFVSLHAPFRHLGQQAPAVRIQHFSPSGGPIYRVGDPVMRIFRIEQGGVRLSRSTPSGDRQISGFAFRGEGFGFEAGPVHQSNAEVLETTIVRSWDLASDEDETVREIALQSAGCAQRSLFVLARRGAWARLAAFLIDLSERQGGKGPVTIPMSRADIADHLGLTTETVSRMFTKLRKEKILRLAGPRAVQLLDVDTMRAALE